MNHERFYQTIKAKHAEIRAETVERAKKDGKVRASNKLKHLERLAKRASSEEMTGP